MFPQAQHRDTYRQPLYFRNTVSREAVSPCYVRRGSAPYSLIENEFVFVHRKTGSNVIENDRRLRKR
jgi:hypothetical protein